MSEMPIIVTSPAQEHESGWRALWDQYCGGAVDASITDATWLRLIDPSSQIGGLVAVLGDELIGFATYVVHECTWEMKPVCYIEDVFVSKKHRGRGSRVARAMAASMVERVHAGEWSRLYGITAADNVVAQRLYSSFSPGHPYVRYVLRGDEA